MLSDYGRMFDGAVRMFVIIGFVLGIVAAVAGFGVVRVASWIISHLRWTS